MPVDRVSSTVLTRQASEPTFPSVRAGKREGQLHRQQQSIRGKEGGHLFLIHATTNQTSDTFPFSLSHAFRDAPMLFKWSQLYCAVQVKYRTLSPEWFSWWKTGLDLPSVEPVRSRGQLYSPILSSFRVIKCLGLQHRLWLPQGHEPRHGPSQQLEPRHHRVPGWKWGHPPWFASHHLDLFG